MARKPKTPAPIAPEVLQLVDPSTPAAEWSKLDDLAAWADNPRDNAKAVDVVAASIRRFGFGAPLVANRRNGELIAGHTRLAAARVVGLQVVPVRWVDLSPDEAHALALADNRTGEVATWDDDKLAQVVRELRDADDDLLAATGFADDELDKLLADLAAPEPAGDNPYTRKVTVPIYEPRGDKPAVGDLVDTAKTRELLEAIEAAELPDDVRAFLRAAAERHTRFHFARIAEFYAHADEQVQALFEASALVIVDFDAAIEHGFVDLQNELFAIADAEDADA
jgi:hypothetical protein